MGWPRKNDEMRIYRDRDGSYIVAMTHRKLHDRSGPEWDAIANVYDGPEPSLVGTQVSLGYIASHWLARVQWDELPADWRDAITRYMRPMDESDPPFDPARIRGFWRVGNQPQSR